MIWSAYRITCLSWGKCVHSVYLYVDWIDLWRRIVDVRERWKFSIIFSGELFSHGCLILSPCTEILPTDTWLSLSTRFARSSAKGFQGWPAKPIHHDQQGHHGEGGGRSQAIREFGRDRHPGSVLALVKSLSHQREYRLKEGFQISFPNLLTE